MPAVEYGMSDAFREFCGDAYNVRMPLEYPPLKLTTVSSPEDLPRAVFNGGFPRQRLTGCGRCSTAVPAAGV